MTWYFSEQVYSMPSLRDIPNESPPIYNGDNFVSQNNYVLPHSLEYHDSASSRYNLQSFPYLPGDSEALGYCQPQYSSTAPSGQHQTYRDNPFVWIGTNNFYPSPSYEQRYLEDSYNIPQRQAYRRHANDRSEKANSRKRRAPTVAQRRAANIRERRRMYNLNEAFDCLRQRIPTFAYEKRLSRIETLRLAISYISFMAGIVNGEDPSTLRVSTYDPPICQAGAAAMTQPCLRHEDSIPASQSCENDDYDDDIDDDDRDDGDGVDGTDNEDECEGEDNGRDFEDDDDECLLDANGDVPKRL